MSVLFTHPTGAPFVREAARALDEAHLLSDVVTTFAHRTGSAIDRVVRSLPHFIGRPLRSELNRRNWCEGLSAPVHQAPVAEFLRVAALRSGLSRALGIRDQVLFDRVAASLDRYAAHRVLNASRHLAIYGYEDSAAVSFSRAKELGLRTIYDLPIAFHRTARQILAEEGERYPEFLSLLGEKSEPMWKIERKEQEVALADRIIVASSFSKRSLVENGIAEEKITCIPYGAPSPTERTPAHDKRPFTVLFVGRIGPRKGVHYLLEAWRLLKFPHAELRLVGVDEFPRGWLAQHRGTANVVGALPHLEIHKEYVNADCLVLPSLVEGFGLVLLEAMSFGVPVITTSHTAGADIVSEGKHGFVVPIRDLDALMERLEWMYTHRHSLSEMTHHCLEKARASSWERYREGLQEVVKREISLIK